MKIKLLLVAIVIFISSPPARAHVRLPDVLGNSMVLQQKQIVPIWGFAEAGESVTVSFGKQKKQLSLTRTGNGSLNSTKCPRISVRER